MTASHGDDAVGAPAVGDLDMRRLREAEAVDLFRRFYDRENSRTLGTEAHGDKRTRRRTAARDSGGDGAT